jgi:hypothetical protein
VPYLPPRAASIPEHGRDNFYFGFVIDYRLGRIQKFYLNRTCGEEEKQELVRDKCGDARRYSSAKGKHDWHEQAWRVSFLRHRLGRQFRFT